MGATIDDQTAGAYVARATQDDEAIVSSCDREGALGEWSLVEARGDGLQVEAALEREAMVMNTGELKAVLSVSAPAVDSSARAPLRLTAVLDKSGSMGGEKLRLVKETMLFMLRHLSERDALGIIEYDTEVKVAAPLTYCNADGRSRLEAALKRLRSGSQTNLSGGLLKGLALHSNAVHDAATAQASEQLQRVRIGNTYKRLTPEEAQERPHYGHPGATPPGDAERVHEWTMMIRFEVPEDEALVRKVVYNLHETFRDPTVEVFEAPFQLTRFGWGTFVVFVEIHLHDGRILKQEHKLSFDQPETFRTVLLPLRSVPDGLDYKVNGVKKVRVTALDLQQGVSSLRNPAAQGWTLHMDGVSYGPWTAQRRTTVPDDQLEMAERVVALFHGKSSENVIQFTDTDGDTIVFEGTQGSRTKPSLKSEPQDQETGVVRSTFLFTDGLANHGITDPKALCAAAQGALEELKDRRCTVSTFGFGQDHNADLLQTLAEMGSGIYSYVDGEDRIAESFGEALGGLLSTTHQNVCLSLQLAPGLGLSRAFTSYPVEGPTAGDDGLQTVRIELGDLFAEERRDVLVSLSLGEALAEGTEMLGQVEARGFSVLGKGTDTTRPLAITVKRQAGDDTGGERHPQVERHWNRYVATEALDAGRQAAHRGDLTTARRLLAEACETLGASPLTARGDTVCLGLLTDLNECIADLQHQETYQKYGSKKMACMQGAHMKQRACFGQDFSEAYSNVSMKSMKARFKDGCK